MKNLYFSERMRLEDKVVAYMKEQGMSMCTFNIIGTLGIMGLLKNDEARQMINEPSEGAGK